MKIIIHSIEELLQLTELIRPQETVVLQDPVKDREGLEILRKAMRLNDHNATLQGQYEFEQACQRAAEPDGLPNDIAAPQAVVAQAATEIEAGPKDDVAEPWPERDADGAMYSTDWHSDPKKLNADGRWRARRKRDEDAYAVWLAQAAEIYPDAEPVATETHALPQPDGDETAAEPQEACSEPTAAPAQPASAVDLQALVAASQEAAKDAADGLPTLLVTCREFTSAHGTAEFNALKAAVAPRGDTGASLQEFTPVERRLMLACIANYPKPE